MAVQEIPLALETPLYEMRTTLAGREYKLRLDYNGREDRWYLGVWTVDTNELVAGSIKVVCGVSLLQHVRWKPTCPPGALRAMDLGGTPDSPGDAPGFTEFGRRVRLFYDDGGAT